MISTDNDPVMEKFTNRMLPETQFRGHYDEHKISSHAQQGNGAITTMCHLSYEFFFTF